MRTIPMRKVGLFVIPTVALLAVAMTTEQINYRFPALNAVVRKLTTRLSDMASVKDFGAVCDSGGTDDTVAVNRALATGVPVFTPATSCRTTGALGTISGGSILAKSISLTTPLPLASGGTGTSVVPPCGAGVVTSDGSKLLCTALSGLAPPGTTGVTLQSVSPGSPQVGHINVRGNIISSITQPPPTAAWQGMTGYSSAGGGLFLSGTNNVGGTITGGWRNYVDIFPSNFNANVVSSGSLYGWYGPRTGNALMTWYYDTASGSGAVGSRCTDGVGCINTRYSGCGSGASGFGPPCITTDSGAGISTALYLGGQMAATGATNKVVTTTGLTNIASGNIFESQNNGVVEFGVGYNGVLASAGLTSTGPVSGTTGTFSGTVSLSSQAAPLVSSGYFTALSVNTAGGWSAGFTDSAPRYFKEATGVVHLMGSVVSGGGLSSTLCNAGALPTGFRPKASRFGVMLDSAGFGTQLWVVAINSDGSIGVNGAGGLTTGHTYYLDAISFPAEQ